MTKLEENTERRYIYEERLGILGLSARDYPTADQHNMAVAEASAHISALKLQDARDAIHPLLKLRDSL